MHEQKTGVTIDSKTLARLITGAIGASVIYFAMFLISYSKLSQKVDDLDRDVQDMKVVLSNIESGARK